MVETESCPCGLCGQDVNPGKDSHIRSTCTSEECGSSIWHWECIKEYLESGQADKKGCCNSKKLLVMKVDIQKRPWEHLKGRNCPVGRGKFAEAQEAEQCPGRVDSAECFVINKKKKQKNKNAEQMPPKAPFVKGPKGPSLPQAPKKPEQKALDKHEPLHNNFDYHHPYNRPRKRHDRDGDGESVQSGNSKASEYVFADNVAWCSEEEIEAAIVQGFLREDYRTNLCQTVAESTPCHLANRCQHAHALCELRLDAAIALEKIPPDFKASLCDDLLTTGHCSEGIACPRAHSLEELRVLAAIQQNLLPANFKTDRCSAYDTSQTCPRGEMCAFAHGSKQLRVEAAIQAGKLPKDFKCHLCPLWWAGEPCPNGDHCAKAHGLQELRMQAAINQQILKDVYKTQRCSKVHCKGPLGTATCWFFHSDQDQLKPVGYKSQFCKTWKETGNCSYGKECHFAHAAKELVIRTVASKFVEKSVEGDDSASQFSIDGSVDFAPGKKEVGIVPYSVQNGKMPVGVPQAAKQGRRKAAKGVALQLCAHFERTGQCPDPKCRFAHGAEELKLRQLKARGGEEGGAAGGKTFNAALAPAPRKLSLAVLDAMRSHKLQAAVHMLMGMGFSFKAAEDAARTTGANAELAAQLLLDGGGFHEGGVTETSVKGEADALCAMADSLDLATSDVEAEVIRCHGDHLKAIQELQQVKLNGGRSVVRPPVPIHRRPPTIPEEESNHEYLNKGWKSMAAPTWGPTGSSAPAASTYLHTPALLPHNAPASIGTPYTSFKAPVKNISAPAPTDEWQQYRPEDFDPDPATPATGSGSDADLHAALLASMADAPPLGPATGSKNAVHEQQINHAQSACQHPQTRPRPLASILDLQTQPQPGAYAILTAAPSMPQLVAPATVAPHAAAPASRNWFPPVPDTAAFQPAATAVPAMSDALSNLHIAPLHTAGAADGCNGDLASGEVTPQPSINFDLSPPSVISPCDGPSPSAQQLLPWLTNGTSKAKTNVPAPVPAPVKSAPVVEEAPTEDFDSLMSLLMS